ncbi:MAG: VOC family protein [Bacteroidetes bacterium]|nr:MAG: VOC family protein [Bacteroidota bacterium]
MNIKQAVPFFAVNSMDTSLQFYTEGLAFEIKNKWQPRGKIEWSWLEREGAAIMLQEFQTDGPDSWKPDGKVGIGVSINFLCEDSLKLYHEFMGRGLQPSEPFVGNHMWVVSLRDPDGYSLFFESATDVAEETKHSEWRKN